MLYVLPAATLAMLAYIAWVVIFRMRRERVIAQRELTRGKFTLRRPKDRIRFLLNSSFTMPEKEAEWEEPVLSALRNHSIASARTDQDPHAVH